MTVSHEWPALTDLSGTPSHSATIRDVLLPAIRGRLEVQVYAATSSLPAAGDFSGQLAAVGSAPYAYFSWTGTAWRVFGVPEFATTTARDTAITTPAANDRCMVGSGTTWVEYTYTGSAWTAGAWTTYTPTVTNLTKGSGGTLTAAWSQDGKTVSASGQFVFGPGSAVGTLPTFTLPSAAVRDAVGAARLVDSGTRGYSATCYVTTGSDQVRFALPTAVDYITATNPMTWATGDQIVWSITYEVA